MQMGFWKNTQLHMKFFFYPGYFLISGQVALILSHWKWHLMCHNLCYFSGLIDRQTFPKAHFGLFTPSLLLAQFADLNMPFGSHTCCLLLCSEMTELLSYILRTKLYSSKWKQSYQIIDTYPNERQCWLIVIWLAKQESKNPGDCCR